MLVPTAGDGVAEVRGHFHVCDLRRNHQIKKPVPHIIADSVVPFAALFVGGVDVIVVSVVEELLASLAGLSREFEDGLEVPIIFDGAAKHPKLDMIANFRYDFAFAVVQLLGCCSSAKGLHIDVSIGNCIGCWIVDIAVCKTHRLIADVSPDFTHSVPVGTEELACMEV